jgi:uncharacterized protein YndB with AHSA1/START domain
MAAGSSTELVISTPSDLEVVATRVFNAPRELVFRAYVDPELVPRWWGPRKYSTVVEKMEVRPGGAWRYVQRDESGNEFAFSGRYQEISEPERIVWTFNFEPIGPGHEAVETVVFEEVELGTRMTSTSRFASIEDRNGMMESGMESGYSETLQRLDEVLEELKTRA